MNYDQKNNNLQVNKSNKHKKQILNTSNINKVFQNHYNSTEIIPNNIKSSSKLLKVKDNLNNLPPLLSIYNKNSNKINLEENNNLNAIYSNKSQKLPLDYLNKFIIPLNTNKKLSLRFKNSNQLNVKQDNNKMTNFDSYIKNCIDNNKISNSIINTCKYTRNKVNSNIINSCQIDNYYNTLSKIELSNTPTTINNNINNKVNTSFYNNMYKKYKAENSKYKYKIRNKILNLDTDNIKDNLMMLNNNSSSLKKKNSNNNNTKSPNKINSVNNILDKFKLKSNFNEINKLQSLLNINKNKVNNNIINKHNLNKLNNIPLLYTIKNSKNLLINRNKTSKKTFDKQNNETNKANTLFKKDFSKIILDKNKLYPKVYSSPSALKDKNSGRVSLSKEVKLKNYLSNKDSNMLNKHLLKSESSINKCSEPDYSDNNKIYIDCLYNNNNKRIKRLSSIENLNKENKHTYASSCVNNKKNYYSKNINAKNACINNNNENIVKNNNICHTEVISSSIDRLNNNKEISQSGYVFTSSNDSNRLSEYSKKRCFIFKCF